MFERKYGRASGRAYYQIAARKCEFWERCAISKAAAYFPKRCVTDLSESAKVHKFTCELRVLLASGKHLGSAE